MPSPFPGMNPYLEQDDAWHDFHEAFLPRAREVLAAQLPAHYVLKIDEQVFIHEPSADQRVFMGRAHVFVASPKQSSVPSGAARASAPAAVRFPAVVDFESLSYLEIRDRRDRKLVTVIELLSPTNKYSGPDREQFLGKRKQLLRSSVHYVEIDLLRGGPRLPFADPLPECDYYALVSRWEERLQAAEFWPLRLRDRLPEIPIPLHEPDPDARLDLQAVLHHVYDGARYENYIYDAAPVPALGTEDEAWARQLLPARG